MAFKASPLTYAELAAQKGQPIIPKPTEGRQIVCAKCGYGSGTLIKQDDKIYIHQDRRRCEILRSIKKKDANAAKGSKIRLPTNAEVQQIIVKGGRG